MRKIMLDLAVSLDGFIEGPQGETDWCIMDPDMNFEGFLSSVDVIFYGRVSYDTWGKFQPDANASELEKNLWKAIHEKQKFVFSRLPRAETDATFLSENWQQHVQKIKAQPGNDIWLYGGANLIRSFELHGLIDIYRLSVHPIILGAGKPLFEDLTHRRNLRLLNTRVYTSGVVQLIYESAREGSVVRKV